MSLWRPGLSTEVPAANCKEILDDVENPPIPLPFYRELLVFSQNQLRKARATLPYSKKLDGEGRVWEGKLLVQKRSKWSRALQKTDTRQATHREEQCVSATQTTFICAPEIDMPNPASLLWKYKKEFDKVRVWPSISTMPVGCHELPPQIASKISLHLSKSTFPRWFRARISSCNAVFSTTTPRTCL